EIAPSVAEQRIQCLRSAIAASPGQTRRSTGGSERLQLASPGTISRRPKKRSKRLKWSLRERMATSLDEGGASTSFAFSQCEAGAEWPLMQQMQLWQGLTRESLRTDVGPKRPVLGRVLPTGERTDRVEKC